MLLSVIIFFYQLHFRDIIILLIIIIDEYSCSRQGPTVKKSQSAILRRVHMSCRGFKCVGHTDHSPHCGL